MSSSRVPGTLMRSRVPNGVLEGYDRKRRRGPVNRPEQGVADAIVEAVPRIEIGQSGQTEQLGALLDRKLIVPFGGRLGVVRAVGRDGK